jgi:hypothetical protein
MKASAVQNNVEDVTQPMPKRFSKGAIMKNIICIIVCSVSQPQRLHNIMMFLLNEKWKNSKEAKTKSHHNLIEAM